MCCASSLSLLLFFNLLIERKIIILTKKELEEYKKCLLVKYALDKKKWTDDLTAQIQFIRTHTQGRIISASNDFYESNPEETKVFYAEVYKTHSKSVAMKKKKYANSQKRIEELEAKILGELQTITLTIKK